MRTSSWPGAAAYLPQLLALLARELPDAVITDIRMPLTGRAAQG